MLKINSKAPLFNLHSTNGEAYSLKNSLEKYVVLYFYPKDDTPGCTQLKLMILINYYLSLKN